MLATGRSADELPLFGEDVDKETAAHEREDSSL